MGEIKATQVIFFAAALLFVLWRTLTLRPGLRHRGTKGKLNWLWVAVGVACLVPAAVPPVDLGGVLMGLFVMLTGIHDMRAERMAPPDR